MTACFPDLGTKPILTDKLLATFPAGSRAELWYGVFRGSRYSTHLDFGGFLIDCETILLHSKHVLLGEYSSRYKILP